MLKDNDCTIHKENNEKTTGQPLINEEFIRSGEIFNFLNEMANANDRIQSRRLYSGTKQRY